MQRPRPLPKLLKPYAKPPKIVVADASRRESFTYPLSLLRIMNIVIRPTLASEHHSLEALHWRASLANEGDREALLAQHDAIELPLQQIIQGEVFVAERANMIVGFFNMVPREDGDIELDGLFVEPSYWRQGIGQLLVEYSARKAKKMGAKFLHVIGNPHAEQFYIACGFEMLGSQQMQLGIGLLMRLKLK